MRHQKWTENNVGGLFRCRKERDADLDKLSSRHKLGMVKVWGV